MRPRDANGDTAQVSAGPDDFRADAAPARSRWRLRAGPPLESDRQLVLSTPLEDITGFLSGPAAMASWFSVTRAPADPEGRVIVGLPDTTTVLYGHETWMDDQHALVFDGERPAVRGFASLRSIILPIGGFGTEVWVHLEMPYGRSGRHHLAALEQVVNRGLARMRAELDRSSR